MKVIALTTAYNRKKFTINTISSLLGQQLAPDLMLEIVIVDDCSYDGTKETIESHYPDIKVLSTEGEAYWSGGMDFGWRKYISGKEYQYLLVFNDDIQVSSKTIIQEMVTASNNLANRLNIIVAPFCDNNGNISYGGLTRRFKYLPVYLKRVPPVLADGCKFETLNMNLALIRREVIDKIGFLSPKFIHSKADIDFGLRCVKHGGEIYQLKDYAGTCDRNTVIGTSRDLAIPLRERLKLLLSVKEHPINERYSFCRVHGGFFWPMWVLTPYLQFLLFEVKHRLFTLFKLS